jgi:hypothetical protein
MEPNVYTTVYTTGEAVFTGLLAVLIPLLAETGLRVRKEALPLQLADGALETDPASLRVRESKSAT